MLCFENLFDMAVGEVSKQGCNQVAVENFDVNSIAIANKRKFLNVFALVNPYFRGTGAPESNDHYRLVFAIAPAENIAKVSLHAK